VTDAALVLESVRAGYGGHPVLENVSLEVSPGEVVGLVGPNGSGKTTVVRVSSRSLKPRSGIVRILGSDPYSASFREAARSVAVVPQGLAPAFEFSVLEVVMMGRAAWTSAWGGGNADDWTLVRDAMETTNVQHLADRSVNELSGGERQRVVLAQALAQDSPVLILDEPTTHLDMRHVRDLVSTVIALARSKRRAVLAVLHDLNLASAVCDRLVVLDSGRVVADGLPPDVVTAQLLREVYGVEAILGTHSGRPSVQLDIPTSIPAPAEGMRRAHVVGGAGRGARLMRALAERGFEVSAGVLHATDSDAVLAEKLNLRRVVVPPFSEIDEASSGECALILGVADVVFLCDAPYGAGNVANLRLVSSAIAQGRRVIVVQGSPIDARDFTGGEATSLWNEISRGALVVGNDEEALSAAEV
jgi:iron complex transport system ATP-binding protein